MSRPLQGALAAEMLAYVDGCLSQREREALEGRMVEFPEIGKQIQQWRAQNELVRAAFADPSPRPFRPVVARPASARSVSAGPAQNRPTPKAPASRQSREPERRPRVVAPASAAQRSSATDAGRGASGRRVCWTLAGALLLWVASAALPPPDPSLAFLEASAAAWRTFAGNTPHPVEIATSDRGAVDRWFATQLGRPAPVPDLAGAGLVLLGGRIVPGAFSPAQFLLYQGARGARVGVAIEALDSPPATSAVLDESGGARRASWTAAGHGFAIFGGASRAQITRLVRMVRDGASRD